MANKEFVIGILGGMGTYATINLFEQYAEIFHANKEWERPRMIIDNRCTMPSRVQAFLYHQDEEKLVAQMTESIKFLVNGGCNHIVLACNTSHLFLPQIIKNYPEASNYVLNMIDTCTSKIKESGVNTVFLLASEGTIESSIYQRTLDKQQIECIVPKTSDYKDLRTCIEAVKQNRYTEDVDKLFVRMANQYDNCILGCTELPILYKRNKKNITCSNVFDPVHIILEELKEEYNND